MSTGDGSESTPKRRAACDECRTKKLKCTGEQPQCARCVREGVSCVYSPQKQMGRPKKRARQEDDVDLSAWYDAQREKAAKQDQQLPLPEASDWQSGTSVQTTWEGFPSLNANTSDTFALLQHWVADGGQQLDLSKPSASVPGLSPDSSISSPQIFSQQQQSQPDHLFPQDPAPQIHVDPNLCGFSTLGGPVCACLSTLYLALNTLQGMDSSFTFPFALHPLREAMQVSAECISCEVCPKRFITGLQNAQILGTLLLSIAERYGKVLESIATEAKRAKAAGENKKFRMSDLNTSTSHLHHGGLGCHAAFNIDLEPDEWHMMAKKVVKAEVFGPSPSSSASTQNSTASTDAIRSHASSSAEYDSHSHGHDRHHDHNPPAANFFPTEPLESPHCPGGPDGEHTHCAYFLGLIQQMMDRQTKWHQQPCPPDAPKKKDGSSMGSGNIPKEQHLCLKMPAFARSVVEGFDWS